MALVLKDRVRETTTVLGTNDATLLGAVTGFQSFAVVGSANTCYYCISDQSGGNWEVGIGTYSSVGPTLARTTILASSNSGSIVAFPAGTKDVFLTYPSERAVYLDASGNLDISGAITLSSGTANGVAYLNGSKVLTTGSSLVYDGVTLTAANSTSADTMAIAASTNSIAISLKGRASDNASAIRFLNNSFATELSSIAEAGTGGLAFSLGSSGEQMRINSTGVGIKTATPQYPLDVVSASGSVGIQIRGRSADNIGALVFNNNASSAGTNINYIQSLASASGYMAFGTANTERMRIDYSGNVGISTGNLNFAGTAQRITGDFSASPQSNRVLFQSTTAGGSTSVGLIPNATGTGSNFVAYSAADPTNSSYFQLVGNSGECRLYAGALGTGTTPTMTFYTGGSERMRIDTSGYVGIGTSSPVAQLDVANSSAANTIPLSLSNLIGGTDIASTGINFNAHSGNVLFAQIVGGQQTNGTYADGNLKFLTRGTETVAERMRITSDGSVGIGTSSPATKLHVNVAGSTGAYITSQNTFGTAIFGIGGANQLDIANTSSGTINFFTSATERMRITAGGNVGIGNTAPGVALEVSGGVRASSGSFAAFNTTNGYTFTSDPDTGVGNPSDGVIAFGTNGSERMRLTGTDLLVGTTTSVGAGLLSVKGTAVGANSCLAIGPVGGSLGQDSRITFGSTFSNNWGGADYGVRYTGAIQYGASGGTGDPRSWSMRFLIGDSGDTPTERMRLDYDGNLLLGTQSAVSGSSTFYINKGTPVLTLKNGGVYDSSTVLSLVKTGSTNNTSQIYLTFLWNGGANGNGAIAGNGDAQCTFITFSDARLKTNIENLPPQLENIMALRPVKFDYKKTGNQQLGFIAQEVQQVYPDLVSEGDDGFLTLAGMDKNYARLVKAIQELKADLDATKSELAALKGA